MTSLPSSGREPLVSQIYRRKGKGRKHAGDPATELWMNSGSIFPEVQTFRKGTGERKKGEERDRKGATEISASSPKRGRKNRTGFSLSRRLIYIYPIKWRRGGAARPPGRPATSTTWPGRPGYKSRCPWLTMRMTTKATRARTRTECFINGNDKTDERQTHTRAALRS